MLISKNDLKQKFQNPLPGQGSHIKMAPSNRMEALFGMRDMIPFAKKSAVLILLFPENEHLKIIFIQRSEYEGVHSGQIAFPGGKKEEADIDFVATALRETFEEIGVESNKIEIIGQLSDLFVPPSNFLIKVYVAFSSEKLDYNIDKNEVQSVIEANIADLLDNKNKYEKEFYAGAMGLKISAPYYKVNNVEIWGATAMIVSELLDILTTN
jgi:8-oxo-dGTP pyrophosphatase MutT (NUDIX family)